jgi:SAM-dependent methyltransferase
MWLPTTTDPWSMGDFSATMGTTTVKHRLPRQPVRAALGALLRAVPHLRPRIEKLLWRGFYELASFGRRDLVSTMNYGYAGAHRALGLDGHADRYGLQLYAAALGEADLSDKDVLEVGCGRGGGASFVFSRLAPRSITGLDLAATAIERARASYARPGVEFVVGAADELPFPDASFDVLMSVESTHCYPDIPRFLAEAKRVLRPGGLFALADFRRIEATAQSTNGSNQDLAALRAQLNASGFRMLEEEDITSQVIRSLELNSPAVRARTERRVPRFLRKHALEFAAVEGSTIYRDFTERTLLYLRFVLQRPC